MFVDYTSLPAVKLSSVVKQTVSSVMFETQVSIIRDVRLGRGAFALAPSLSCPDISLWWRSLHWISSSPSRSAATCGDTKLASAGECRLWIQHFFAALIHCSQ